MRFSLLMAQTVRMLDHEQAEAYVGGPHILDLMQQAKWIKPAVRRHRMTRWDVKVLDDACDRLQAGEWPEAIEPAESADGRKVA